MTDKELLELAKKIISECQDAKPGFDGCNDWVYDDCPVCGEHIDKELPIDRMGHEKDCSIYVFLKHMESRIPAPTGPGGIHHQE